MDDVRRKRRKELRDEAERTSPGGAAADGPMSPANGELESRLDPA